MSDWGIRTWMRELISEIVIGLVSELVSKKMS